MNHFKLSCFFWKLYIIYTGIWCTNLWLIAFVKTKKKFKLPKSRLRNALIAFLTYENLMYNFDIQGAYNLYPTPGYITKKVFLIFFLIFCFFLEVDQLTRDLSGSNLSGATPKFIKDTTSYWYKPDITRKQVCYNYT